MVCSWTCLLLIVLERCLKPLFLTFIEVLRRDIERPLRLSSCYSLAGRTTVRQVKVMETMDGDEIHNCSIKLVNLLFPHSNFHSHSVSSSIKASGGVNHVDILLQRNSPNRRRDKVYIGCGAGFGGDRSLATLKLLKRVKELNYLVLECLAERTLADRYQIMVSGGDGYDSQSKCFQFVWRCVFQYIIEYPSPTPWAKTTQ